MIVTTPNRVVRRYVQQLVAPPAQVFPLLCPVREADWIDGWDPERVVSASGGAEPDCVFVTSSPPGRAIWYVTRHEPASGRVEMIKITPEITACRLTIQLRAGGPGTEAEVVYAHTSLGPAGDAFLEGFTEAFYRQFMQDWEKRLNHYLLHGTALRVN